MAGSRVAGRKKTPRKAAPEGVSAPGGASVERDEKSEVGEKRVAKKPVRQPAPPEGGGMKGRWEDFLKFLRSVRAELKRVSWPSWHEVRAATIVVVMTLVVISGFMGIVDWILTLVFGQKHTGF